MIQEFLVKVIFIHLVFVRNAENAKSSTWKVWKYTVEKHWLTEIKGELIAS